MDGYLYQAVMGRILCVDGDEPLWVRMGMGTNFSPLAAL